MDPTVNSRGWVTSRYCEYPQELIIQFSQIVQLKQLQFLSHQSKISKRIEIMTYDPLTQGAQSNQLPLSQIQFTKLGFLNFESNERSGF